MGSLQRSLTEVFLKQASLPADEDSVRSYRFRWWKNPREKLKSGLTLTDEGFQFLAETLNLRYYEVAFPADFQFTAQIVLWLDNFIECPHYYSKKEIIVFREKTASELMLFSGDVRKYGTAKAMARQRELESQKFLKQG